MHWICENDESIEPDREKDGRAIYNADTKRKVLARHYRQTRSEPSIDTGQFIGNLETFYDHRNAIMHDDPDAHIDMNLATVAVLFCSLSLYTIVGHYYDFDEAFGIEDVDEEKLWQLIQTTNLEHLQERINDDSS